MGGCRCTYRNCNARSDGQTHMFHFPVFNKMRCHQWITNARKPNFLNLKLSQLRNRVICQHHFKDDNFMNFMRDKLKSDAVPTEDGPLCVSEQIQTLITEENDKPAIPINVDDIENETLHSVDKKAHSSVKYGDFLISDVTELFNTSHNNIDSQVSQKKVLSHRNPDKTISKLFNEFNSFDYKYLNHEENNKYTINYTNDEPIQVKQTNPLYRSKPASNPTIVAIEYEDTNPNKTLEIVGKQRESENFNTNVRNPDKLVTIISEKKISEPFVVGGKLEPISPSMIIKPKRLKSNMIVELNDWDTNTQLKNEITSRDTNLQANVNNNIISQDQTIVFEQTLPIEYTPKAFETKPIIYQGNHIEENLNPLNIIHLNNIENNTNFNEGIDKQNVPITIEPLFNIEEEVKKPDLDKPKPFFTPVSTPVYKSVLKSKITPEKLAVIEQKRKFNLKLKDVITSCLDNLEEPTETIGKKITHAKKQTAKRSLLKDPIPANSHSSMIAYLESRLQKLEDTLLNKIDHNTQRINELKRTLKPSSNSRNVNTQTYLNHMTEESQKQYLYKEISRFLSPNANIKIYEELFMDKSSQEEIQIKPRKLRRKR